MRTPITRRALLAATAAIAVWPRALRAAARRNRGPHPTPRPGITAAKVGTKDDLGKHADLLDLFDQIREIPEIADGIHCQCPCGSLEDYYSLLTCYETPGLMATSCPICQGQGRLVYRMHKEGKTLDEIRRGVDARFG